MNDTKNKKISIQATILIAITILASTFFLFKIVDYVLESKMHNALDECLVHAERHYISMWLDRCHIEEKLTKECDQLLETDLVAYADKNNKKITPKFVDSFIKAQKSCACLLEAETSDRLSDTLKDLKSDCFRRYK